MKTERKTYERLSIIDLKIKYVEKLVFNGYSIRKPVIERKFPENAAMLDFINTYDDTFIYYIK